MGRLEEAVAASMTTGGGGGGGGGDGDDGWHRVKERQREGKYKAQSIVSTHQRRQPQRWLPLTLDASSGLAAVCHSDPPTHTLPGATPLLPHLLHHNHYQIPRYHPLHNHIHS
ncbi:hypothetical protein Pmani_032566 [Petrolisthes manimaculis]|uniref:Uncharacterized protein n=1 Tax=Petrolisthes manimaculis TaxID=1843537 RepID=A0AAE1TQZ2_9EUCA|nr:hypothetical protein Pmani_032566 [Petrolisthes manimaculis]